MKKFYRKTWENVYDVMLKSDVKLYVEPDLDLNFKRYVDEDWKEVYQADNCTKVVTWEWGYRWFLFYSLYFFQIF